MKTGDFRGILKEMKGCEPLKKYLITTVLLVLVIAGVVGTILLRSGEGPTATAPEEYCPQPCAHSYWEAGTCRDCGVNCIHRQWVDGMCIRCGYCCDHETWLPNQCARCGMACPHEEYNTENHSCAHCGVELSHLYDGYLCRVCSQPLELEDDTLPWEIFYHIPEAGTVEKLSYEAPDYYALSLGEPSAVTYSKDVCVYLPYNYDPTRQYDVLVLLHGMGGNEEYWLLAEQDYHRAKDEYLVRTKELLDNMIAQQLCNEVIVVTPTFYRDTNNLFDYNRRQDQLRFSKELQEIILPLIVETYSTYAADSSRESISAARQHFAFAGLSMGSIYGYNAVLPESLDLFAWYGLFSGSECDNLYHLASVLNAPENLQYPISFFYNSAGTRDVMGELHYEQYRELLGLYPNLVDGKNATFTYIKGAFHEYRAWCTGLYNFLRIAFH